MEHAPRCVAVIASMIPHNSVLRSRKQKKRRRKRKKKARSGRRRRRRRKKKKLHAKLTKYDKAGINDEEMTQPTYKGCRVSARWN